MKQKTKGISLIVLVITIIIIIILAGAVILSLSNSNVINKAKAGVMQTDLSTVKEQIKTKMAENELNNINTKIGTQLWDSYYTLSVSQLQEIGITTKSDYIYNYNTGDLSVKQNNEYVTPEEVYPTEPQGAYIEGYLGSKYLTVTDSTPAKQALINKYTNGSIKLMLVEQINIEDLAGDETVYNNFEASLLAPKYSVSTNNSGYFRLENITPGTYTLVIKDDINILLLIKNITISAGQAKVISTKTSPIRLYMGDVNIDYFVEGGDVNDTLNSYTSSNIRKYDLNKDSKIDILDVNIIVNDTCTYDNAYLDVIIN